MKQFNLNMLGSDAGKLSAHYQGQGKVEFPLNKPDMETVLSLRSSLTDMGAKIGTNPDPAEAHVMIYKMAVVLVRKTISVKMDDDQATQVVLNCGGARGDLVFELAKAFGVKDIMFANIKEAADEEDIPT